MRQATASASLLEQLALQQRRVLSEWRALILLRRATLSLPDAARRWSVLPREPADIRPVLRQMRQRGEIEPIPDLMMLFEVTVPYARQGFVGEDEPLFEAHPYAALSHVSALVLHGLTDDLPKRLTVVIPADGTGDMLPLDTDATDWDGIPLVRGRRPPKILGHPVLWTKLAPARLFGVREYRPRGYPIRATTPERTLLDGLRDPDLCGGLENVLRAWTRAADTLDLDALVHHVERFDIDLLRQRTGYVLDELERSHPMVERWQRLAKRGGSSKLLSSESYAPTYSERWSLSLNAPISALRDDGP